MSTQPDPRHEPAKEPSMSQQPESPSAKSAVIKAHMFDRFDRARAQSILGRNPEEWQIANLARAFAELRAAERHRFGKVIQRLRELDDFDLDLGDGAEPAAMAAWDRLALAILELEEPDEELRKGQA